MPKLGDWSPTSLAALIAALALAAAAGKFIWNGGNFTYESPIGKILIESGANNSNVQFAGSEGKSRDETKMVWQSDCPGNSRPISGTCIVLPQKGPAPPLQNIGPNISEGANRWECAWQGRVENAVVRAVCVTTQK